MSTRDELRKIGPIEDDTNRVVGAAFDVEEIGRAALNWVDADDISAKAREAVSALDELSGALAAWFERNDS